MKRITSLLLALSVLLALPSQAAAWGFIDNGWNVINDDVTFCFEDTFSEWSKSALRPIIHQFDNLPNSNLDMIEENCGIGTNIRYRVAQNPGNELGRASGNVQANGEKATPWYVTLDIDRQLDVQWSLHPIFCTVQNLGTAYVGGNDCKVDSNILFGHETGHALGLSHNTVPETQYCVAGYTHDQRATACSNDYYTEAFMWYGAGDGYHRGLSNDDIWGLAALY